METEKDYQVKISIEPWQGEVREGGNVFSFERAEQISELLREIRNNIDANK